jgi:murein DD-endopeptidase MepM/ murein hydrolase activator NlpD
VTADAANVRTLPGGAGSQIVGVVRRGDLLPAHKLSEPDGQNMVWVRVTVPANNLPGWIRGDLVQLTGDCAAVGALGTTVNPPPAPTPVVPPPAPPPGQVEILPGDCRAEVKVASARVRAEASSSSASRGFIPRGTVFAVKRVSTADNQGFHWFGFDFLGAPGWVRQDLLDLTGDCLDPASHENGGGEPAPAPTPTPAPAPAPTAGCMALVGLPQVNVRKQPSAAAGLAGTAASGESFAVREVTAAQPDGFRWARVDFRGQTGFIRIDLVSLMGDCSAFTGDDRMAAPVAAPITQGFKTNHQGLDFGASPGMEVRVAMPATVERAHACTKCTPDKPNIVPASDAERNQIFSDPGWGFGYGNHIILRHEFKDVPRSMQDHILRNGGNSSQRVYVLYAHLSRMDVHVNDKMAAGAVIGATGHTGNSTAPHLHLEVAFGNTWGSSRKVHPSALFAVQNI